MSEIGKYIYGIINCNEEKFWGPYGITACERIYTIPYRDISALVSDSETVDYTHMLKDALARLLVRHQKVIERIMSLEHTIIPIKLGTFAIDRDEVRHILAKSYPLIKDLLNKIFNKIEIDVVATWGDFNSVVKEAGEEKEIKEFKEGLLANPKGITVNDQMKVGAMVKNHLDQRRGKYTLEIQTSLSRVSEYIKVHDLMDDKMVTNFAFLIDKRQQEGFDREVEELNSRFHDVLNFRCVGPLPPYSFYTLEIKKMQFKEIDWARKKLGLFHGFATKDEIKRAYHISAISFHPDKNPNISGIERQFDEVQKAYRILCEYSLSAEQSGQGDIYSFNEREFKRNAILVKVKE